MSRLRLRRGQTTVETMLLISVIVIAVVAGGLLFTQGDSGFVAAMQSLSEEATTVYAQPN